MIHTPTDQDKLVSNLIWTWETFQEPDLQNVFEKFTKLLCTEDSVWPFLALPVRNAQQKKLWEKWRELFRNSTTQEGLDFARQRLHVIKFGPSVDPRVRSDENIEMFLFVLDKYLYSGDTHRGFGWEIYNWGISVQNYKKVYSQFSLGSKKRIFEAITKHVETTRTIKKLILLSRYLDIDHWFPVHFWVVKNSENFAELSNNNNDDDDGDDDCSLSDFCRLVLKCNKKTDLYTPSVEDRLFTFRFLCNQLSHIFDDIKDHWISLHAEFPIEARRIDQLMVDTLYNKDTKKYGIFNFFLFDFEYRMKFKETLRYVIEGRDYQGGEFLNVLEPYSLYSEFAAEIDEVESVDGLNTQLKKVLSKSSLTNSFSKPLRGIGAAMGAFMTDSELVETLKRVSLSDQAELLSGILETSQSVALIPVVIKFMQEKIYFTRMNEIVSFITQVVRFAVLGFPKEQVIGFITAACRLEKYASHIVLVHAFLLEERYEDPHISQLLQKFQEEIKSSSESGSTLGWEGVLRHLADCWDRLSEVNRRAALFAAAAAAAAAASEHLAINRTSCIISKDPSHPLFMRIAENIFTRVDAMEMYRTFRESMPAFNVNKVKLASHWFFVDEFHDEASLGGLSVITQLIRRDMCCIVMYDGRDSTR
jgi:hypothetical protein